MELSLLLMQEIIKLFAIMVMGFVIVKSGLMKSSDSKSLSVIMAYLINPCVILNAFQVDATPEVQKGLLLACIAAIAVHILFLVVTAILKKPLNLDVVERATLIYPNAGILVIPLVERLLGQEYVIYSSAFIAIQLILLWTHCKNMLCGEQSIDWKKILFNVNIISIAAGIVLFWLRIEFPSGVQDVLGSMSNMIGPLGMLIAGMTIADKSLLSVFARKRSYLSATLRLLVYPVLVLILMKLISNISSGSDTENILLTVYLASITPACAMITTMAQLYDKDAAYASSLYVLTTLLSILTMPVMVYLFQVVI